MAAFPSFDDDVEVAPERKPGMRNLVMGGIVALVLLSIPYLMYSNAQAEKHERTIKVIAEQKAKDEKKAKDEAAAAVAKEEADKQAKADVEAKEKARLAKLEAERSAERDVVRAAAAGKVEGVMQSQAEIDRAVRVERAREVLDNESMRIRIQADIAAAQRAQLEIERENLKAQRERDSSSQRINNDKQQLREICMQRYNRPDC